MTAVGDGGGWEMSSGTQAGRLMEVSGTRIGMYVGDGARVPRVGLGFKSEALGGGTVGCGWLAATGQAHPTGGWLWGAAWRAKGRLPLRVSAGQHCRVGGRVDAYRQMDAARGVVVRALFAKSSLSGAGRWRRPGHCGGGPTDHGDPTSRGVGRPRAQIAHDGEAQTAASLAATAPAPDRHRHLFDGRFGFAPLKSLIVRRLVKGHGRERLSLARRKLQ